VPVIGDRVGGVYEVDICSGELRNTEVHVWEVMLIVVSFSPIPVG
jgi:hypothetical protein